MLTVKEMEEIRQKDQKKIESIETKTGTIRASKIDEIEKKLHGIRDKIQELVDQKHELFTQPLTKAETVALAKKGLKEQKETWFFKEFLDPHLKDCQNGHNVFLNQDTMRGFWDRQSWKLIYTIIKEEDIEKAAEMLPDIGLSEAERNAQIKAIDEGIVLLEGQVEKELRKL